MYARPGKHPDEQTLEAYLLSSLPLRKARRIEEHLLACPECLESSEQLEDYIRSMRAALGNGKVKLTIARKTHPV
jgi:anti-sigma factor RsiW